MSESKNRIVVLLAATAAAGAGGAVIAAAAQRSHAPANTTATTGRWHPHANGQHLGRRHDLGRRGGRGRRALSSAQLDQIATKLGVGTDRLKAALDAARPDRVKPAAREQNFAAAIATELGVAGDEVLKILQNNRPQPPAGGGRPGGGPRHDCVRPASGALVTALAQGLHKDKAAVEAALDKVREAHRNERTERRDAFFAAIAGQLGVDAAKVKAAFVGVLGSPPAPPAPDVP